MEEKLRKFLSRSERPLQMLKNRLENEECWKKDTILYIETLEALRLHQEICKELGYKEDKPDIKNKLKNHKLF